MGTHVPLRGYTECPGAACQGTSSHKVLHSAVFEKGVGPSRGHDQCVGELRSIPDWVWRDSRSGFCFCTGTPRPHARRLLGIPRAPTSCGVKGIEGVLPCGPGRVHLLRGCPCHWPHGARGASDKRNSDAVCHVVVSPARLNLLQAIMGRSCRTASSDVCEMHVGHACHMHEPCTAARIWTRDAPTYPRCARLATEPSMVDVSVATLGSA